MRVQGVQRWALAGAGAAIALLLVGLVINVAMGQSTPDEFVARTPTPAVTATPTQTPTPQPEPTPTRRELGVSPVRLSVPSADIDGEVIDGEVDRTINQMIAPESPHVIAWYHYSTLPGDGGNAVLAGHVDYHDVGPGVLWNLRYVDEGDIVEIELSDGTMLFYRVESNDVHHVLEGPWDELFRSRADDDLLTLYTCDGALEAGEYDSRRVVRARLVETVPGPASGDITANNAEVH